jgi:hypothetical protein
VLILDQFLNSAGDSKRAAAGWGGDRYEIYEGPRPGEVFMAQLTVWDTENDAREFFEAYTKRTKLRYADSKLSEILYQGSKAEADRQGWNTSEGGVVIEPRPVACAGLEWSLYGGVRTGQMMMPSRKDHFVCPGW